MAETLPLGKRVRVLLEASDLGNSREPRKGAKLLLLVRFMLPTGKIWSSDFYAAIIQTPAVLPAYKISVRTQDTWPKMRLAPCYVETLTRDFPARSGSSRASRA